MELYDQSRKNLKMPRGKYRGWIVSHVPEDYLFWVNTAGQDTPLCKWLHKKGPGKPAAQQVREVKNRARKASRYTRHFRDHIGHPAKVRTSRSGLGIVYCLTCQRDIHVMSQQELHNYLAANNPETRT